VTRVLITVDTELSAGRQGQGLPLDANFASSWQGRTHQGDFGVPWLMAQMRARGITGVFFVDPMPGLLGGPALVEQMVQPILAAGHEVQLHIHTEWLAFAAETPVDGRQGRNIGDFSEADQFALIGWARDALVAAGAPAPVAFRAGNYGANDSTLRALAALSLTWDSSFNADYAGRSCALSLPLDLTNPIERDGIFALPVSGIWDRPGHMRPAQVCALSSAEMISGLRYAAAHGAHSFCVVSHSFEMLSRDRQRPNRLVMRRFEALCDAIANDPRLTGGGFHDLAAPAPTPARNGRAPASLPRTMSRQIQQALAQLIYERAWRPS
jgi:hypothetical protein